jgi:hypothetical protein
LVVTMTEHDKIEHELPDGDVLVHDSTRRRPEVDAAFQKVEQDFALEAREIYRRLRQAA